MVFAGSTGLDTGTVVLVIVTLVLFSCLLSLLGGVIAYAIAQTKLAFVLGTVTFAGFLGFGPLGHWLGIAPNPYSRFLEAGLASAALGLGCYLTRVGFRPRVSSAP
jgi:membrane-bound acyltransferase YfiQ involved in biofilm formation